MDANGSIMQTGFLSSPSPTTTTQGEGPAARRVSLNVRRTGIVMKPNNSRVVIRPFEPASEHRIERIIARIMSLSDVEVDSMLDDVMREFHSRHQKTRHFFLHRFEQLKKYLLTNQSLSENRRMLIGAYFTQEYALESAALFNPSMVWHPDQSGLAEGSRRFVLSLRATGEGHISSIIFRSGTLDAQNRIRMDEPTRFVTAPEQVPNTLYDKTLFFRKLLELGVDGSFTGKVLGTLNDQFTLDELKQAVNRAVHQSRPRHIENEPVVQGMLTLAKANYEVSYSPDQHISERVIFPFSPTETNGIEDARFVQFHDDDGSARYYATYTAFDGRVILPQILETDVDFLHFKVSTLNGPRESAQQRICSLSAQGQWPLRHAVAARQREHLPDVLGRDPLLVHQGADRQANLLMQEAALFSSATLRLAAGDRGRLAGLNPRRQRDAQVRDGLPSCSTVTTPPVRWISRLSMFRLLLEPGRQRTRGLRPERRPQSCGCL